MYVYIYIYHIHIHIHKHVRGVRDAADLSANGDSKQDIPRAESPMPPYSGVS